MFPKIETKGAAKEGAGGVAREGSTRTGGVAREGSASRGGVAKEGSARTGGIAREGSPRPTERRLKQVGYHVGLTSFACNSHTL